MAGGEDAARAGLGASVERNKGQVAMTEESRLILAAMLRDEMRVAVAEGIAAAMSEENAERFWKKGFEVAQAEAKKRLREGAGDLVLGGVRGLLKWGSMVTVLVAFAYYLGGWAAAKAVWAAVAPRG